MYVSGNLGLSSVPDMDLNVIGFPTFGTVSLDLGYKIGGALGYIFGAIRAEGEISYVSNGADEGTFVFAPGTGPVDGDISTLNFLVNIYYDFNIENSSLVPYVGLGSGFAIINADITAPNISSLALIDKTILVRCAGLSLEGSSPSFLASLIISCSNNCGVIL